MLSRFSMSCNMVCICRVCWLMDKDIAVRIGKNIANARKTAKRTQEDVAEKLGIDTGSLSRMERGVILPGVPMLDKISDELNVSLWQLLGTASLSSTVLTENIQSLLEQLDIPERRFLLEQIEGWVKQLVAMSRKGKDRYR